MPAASSCCASATRLSIVRLRKRPRQIGIAQKVHGLLHPSATFR